MIPLFRNAAIIAAVLMGAVYAYSVLSGPNGIAAIQDSHSQVVEMEQENERLRREVDRHKEFLRKAGEDPEFRDRLIRQRLEKQKPGETVIYDTGELPKSPAAPVH